MGYLQNIAQLSTDNLGGVIEIKVARKAEVTGVSQPVAGIIYGDIPFTPGAGFVTWRATFNQIGTDSQGKPTREGTTKQNRLKFSIPKDRAPIRAMLEQASEDEFIVLFTDTNGTQKIFGLPHSPVQFRFSHTTGNSPGQKNNYECEFYFDGPDNIFEYQGSIPVAPVGPAPSVVLFNGTPIASLAPGENLNIESEYSFSYFITT